MDYRYISNPSSEPVSIEDMKAYLKIEHNHEDGLLQSLISSARSKAEAYLNRTMISRKVEVTYFKDDRYVAPIIPVLSIDKVSYTKNGEKHQLDPADWKTKCFDEELILMNIPFGLDDDSEIIVEQTTGYSNASDIEQGIILAIKMIVVHSYEQRYDTVQTLTTASQRLLNPHRYFN